MVEASIAVNLNKFIDYAKEHIKIIDGFIVDFETLVKYIPEIDYSNNNYVRNINILKRAMYDKGYTLKIHDGVQFKDIDIFNGAEIKYAVIYRK